MTTKSFTILVDVDDVVADLSREWISRYNMEYNQNLKKEEIVDWDVSRFVINECGQSVFSYFHMPSLYDCMKQIPDALKYTTRLKGDGHKVIFLSSCTIETMEAKAKWLIRNSFVNRDTFESEVIFTKRKDLVVGDFLIDDKPKTLELYKYGTPIRFVQPWNSRTTSTTIRDMPYARTWEQVYSQINFFCKGYMK